MDNIFFEDYRRMRAAKHLGQNFLVQPHLIRKIIAACGVQAGETVLEIGPGKGALTEILAREAGVLFAVEADARFAEGLTRDLSADNVQIIHADFLKYDLARLPKIDRVIGNLPYNIAALIIIALLTRLPGQQPMYFTVQWEFGKRLTAKPRTKDYGSLSCLVQYLAETRILFKIPAGAFKPVPKVQSCFVEVVRRPPPVKAVKEDLLFDLLRQAFSQRRKMLVNALGGMLVKEESIKLLAAAGLKEKSRAEDLSVAEFVRLANVLAQTL